MDVTIIVMMISLSILGSINELDNQFLFLDGLFEWCLVCVGMS